MSNYKLQSQKDYLGKMYNPSQRKHCEVINLESSPYMQPLNYRFEWISEKLKKKNTQPLNTSVTIRNINLSPGHFLNSNHNSYIDSKITHSNERKNNNISPVTTIHCRKTMDDLSQQNKSYTVVNLKFDKLFQKKGSDILFEYKKINVFDQSQNKTEIKNKDCNLNIKGIDDYSSSVKNEKMCNPIECVKYTKPEDNCITSECNKLQKIKENTSITQNDVCENDNKFEITFLNNQQLEIKTIIIE